MTVQELITFLSKKDPNMEVMVAKDQEADFIEESDWAEGYVLIGCECFISSKGYEKKKDELDTENWGDKALVLNPDYIRCNFDD